MFRSMFFLNTSFVTELSQYRSMLVLFYILSYVDILIVQLTLGLKLFKLVFVSRQYDVGFRDAGILEGDSVFRDSLLMFVL
jgi:hypothetical protein